ncbi:hypothetical protein PCANC_08542 [Puccinia coronata f. sp. avenae]|uniref:Uncharacterized protein n=1 Tax=Puccinia coronata f. sp. avenae TaxID=200324 RepID=A0A2N5V1Z7_9BASI|nr:hypothetical protein PCANC_08542 [Puccinia coronata f. sp. avenae]
MPQPPADTPVNPTFQPPASHDNTPAAKDGEIPNAMQPEEMKRLYDCYTEQKLQIEKTLTLHQSNHLPQLKGLMKATLKGLVIYLQKLEDWMKVQPRGNDLGSNDIIDLTLEDSDIQVIIPLANSSQSQAKGNDQNQESKKRKQEAKGSVNKPGANMFAGIKIHKKQKAAAKAAEKVAEKGQSTGQATSPLTSKSTTMKANTPVLPSTHPSQPVPTQVCDAPGSQSTPTDKPVTAQEINSVSKSGD